MDFKKKRLKRIINAFCSRTNGSKLELGSFGKAKDLQRRIFYALGLLIVYRIGTYIPVPGIDASLLRSFFEQANTGIGGMLNMFTGGAVGRMAIFALGIMPYITSSIIMQLLASMENEMHLKLLKAQNAYNLSFLLLN